MVECTLWERDVAGSSPVSPTWRVILMKEKDNLPIIISAIALVLYLAFLFVVTRPKADEMLEGGNIQKAIETEQYR